MDNDKRQSPQAGGSEDRSGQPVGGADEAANSRPEPHDIESPRGNGDGRHVTSRPGATRLEWDHWVGLGLGKHLLPVVSRQGAKLSPNSQLTELGKIPTQYNRSRQVGGIQGWPEKISTAEELRRWREEPDYGICVQAREVRAIDVDISKPDVAQRVREVIERHCKLPVRARADSSKFLMPFRFSASLLKRVITVGEYKIEVLGDGNSGSPRAHTRKARATNGRKACRPRSLNSPQKRLKRYSQNSKTPSAPKHRRNRRQVQRRRSFPRQQPATRSRDT